MQRILHLRHRAGSGGFSRQFQQPPVTRHWRVSGTNTEAHVYWTDKEPLGEITEHKENVSKTTPTNKRICPPPCPSSQSGLGEEQGCHCSHRSSGFHPHRFNQVTFPSAWKGQVGLSSYRKTVVGKGELRWFRDSSWSFSRFFAEGSSPGEQPVQPLGQEPTGTSLMMRSKITHPGRGRFSSIGVDLRWQEPTAGSALVQRYKLL